jgi:hypothetical protein
MSLVDADSGSIEDETGELIFRTRDSLDAKALAMLMVICKQISIDFAETYEEIKSMFFTE